MVIRTTSENKAFKDLVQQLDSLLHVVDGDEHAFFAQYNKIDTLNHVVILYADGEAVGCGAFKKFDAETVEIKRMFVLPNHRRKGYAQQILDQLEKWACEEGNTFTILETSTRLPEAVNLYENCGYQRIPNYGQYIDVPTSVCMKKKLK